MADPIAFTRSRARRSASPRHMTEPTDFVGARAGEGGDSSRGSSCAGARRSSSTMGSPASEPERRPDDAQVEVRLTKGFWVGKYEVTQGDWKRVAAITRRRHPGERRRLPGPTARISPRPTGSVATRPNKPTRRATCRRAGSFGYPPRPSGSTPVGPAQDATSFGGRLAH